MRKEKTFSTFLFLLENCLKVQSSLKIQIYKTDKKREKGKGWWKSCTKLHSWTVAEPMIGIPVLGITVSEAQPQLSTFKLSLAAYVA